MRLVILAREENKDLKAFKAFRAPRETKVTHLALRRFMSQLQQ
nr:MAG TPA: hypothetical protein [Bacteriophage sp.]